MHGHTHVPRLERAASGIYANAGAWYIDQQYLRIDDDRISRMLWKESGESETLDTLNRVAEESASEREKVIGSI